MKGCIQKQDIAILFEVFTQVVQKAKFHCEHPRPAMIFTKKYILFITSSCIFSGRIFIHYWFHSPFRAHMNQFRVLRMNLHQIQPILVSCHSVVIYNKERKAHFSTLESIPFQHTTETIVSDQPVDLTRYLTFQKGVHSLVTGKYSFIDASKALQALRTASVLARRASWSKTACPPPFNNNPYDKWFRKQFFRCFNFPDERMHFLNGKRVIQTLWEWI